MKVIPDKVWGPNILFGVETLRKGKESKDN